MSPSLQASVVTAILLAAFGTSEPSFSAAGAQIQWEKTYEGALERARSSDRPVFLALNTDEESRSEQLVKATYRDDDVARLTKLTFNVIASSSTHAGTAEKLCPRFGCITCADHKKLASSLIPSMFLANEKGIVASPQHIWLDPQGKVVLSVPWELSRDELLWCFVTAVRRVDPKVAVEMPSGARPPHRLLMKSAYKPAPDDEHGRGLTAAECNAWMKEYKQSGKPDPVTILLTDEEPAFKVTSLTFRTFLNEAKDLKFAQHRIHLIGATSPASYWKMLEPYLAHADDNVRHEVAVALEQLSSPQAQKPIVAALGKEKVALNRESLLRALGACGFGDKQVSQTLVGAAKTEKNDLVRRSAMIALGYLQRSDEVSALLLEKLGSDDRDECAAAACAMAMTRDPAYASALEKAVAATSDAKKKEWLALALGVLQGENLSRIEDCVCAVTQDPRKRNRVFFHAEGEKAEW